MRSLSEKIRAIRMVAESNMAPKQHAVLYMRKEDFAKRGTVSWESILDDFEIPHGEESDWEEPTEIVLTVSGAKYSTD